MENSNSDKSRNRKYRVIGGVESKLTRERYDIIKYSNDILSSHWKYFVYWWSILTIYQNNIQFILYNKNVRVHIILTYGIMNPGSTLNLDDPTWYWSYGPKVTNIFRRWLCRIALSYVYECMLVWCCCWRNCFGFGTFHDVRFGKCFNSKLPRLNKSATKIS